jgi:hypothetical protein
MRFPVIGICAFFLIACQSYAARITVGVQWKDDKGNPIHAHGGNIIKVGSTFYLYGENTRNMSVGLEFGAFNGIGCYSSTDFQTWHSEGIACPVRASGSLSTQGIAYRPKVLFNSSASTYVMVLSECCPLRQGLIFAKSSTPTGPFVYQSKWTDQPVMDLGAFKDDDGTAYVVFSNGNHHNSIYRLSSDYLSVANKICDIGPDPAACEEGPALMKANGRYFLVNSWCSYWSPNQNHYRTATNIAGPWSKNPDGNLGNSSTYESQSGHIFPVTGASGATYIFMGDRWDCTANACDLSMSKYVWLPLTISGSSMSMAWYDTWYLDIQKGTWSAQPTSVASRPTDVCAKHVGDLTMYDIHGRKVADELAGRAAAKCLPGSHGVFLAIESGRAVYRIQGKGSFTRVK